MALDRTKFRGKVKIRGRPNEQATAEIRVMKARSRRRWFGFLKFIIVICIIISIYLFYQGKILNGLLVLLVAIILLGYFFADYYLIAKPRLAHRK